MQCPVCNEAMIVLEYEQVEIDHCTSCKGIWLDAGELELLAEDSFDKNRLSSLLQAKQCDLESREAEQRQVARQHDAHESVGEPAQAACCDDPPVHSRSARKRRDRRAGRCGDHARSVRVVEMRARGKAPGGNGKRFKRMNIVAETKPG